jgi:hypothetical protein
MMGGASMMILTILTKDGRSERGEDGCVRAWMWHGSLERRER